AWRNALRDERLEFLFGFDRAGMDGYFRELLAIAGNATTWPPADPAELLALGERYDTFTGPGPKHGS
ncbi:MAG TPA: hypothetical protein VGC80_04425, partial [Acetobacteraceae bacterium]